MENKEEVKVFEKYAHLDIFIKNVLGSYKYSVNDVLGKVGGELQKVFNGLSNIICLKEKDYNEYKKVIISGDLLKQSEFTISLTIDGVSHSSEKALEIIENSNLELEKATKELANKTFLEQLGKKRGWRK